MEEYFEKVEYIQMSRQRKKERDASCTDSEKNVLLQLTGKLNFLGQGALPSAALVASKLQQNISDLKVKHLAEANAALHQLRKLKPVMHYRAPSNPNWKAYYLAFSDAATGLSPYGQTSYLSGLYFPNGEESIYHLVDWNSSKQGRVSYSSVGAEILAAAESTDRSALLPACIQNLFGADDLLPLVLTVDSFGLHSTITTLHEGRDYRLRPTVARLRDSLDSGEIAVMQWVPGKTNLADALTKINPHSFSLLNESMQTGILAPHVLETTDRRLCKGD